MIPFVIVPSAIVLVIWLLSEAVKALRGSTLYVDERGDLVSIDELLKENP